ncbi:MAG: ferrous iron transport protein B [Methanosphaera stadtmanae]|nr:ferrous iron transport protein B [Methanosphaera stadtmanae]
MEKLKFLLAGNPNVGKSTVFNHLTGMKQHVGNWPGKTVEQKSGSFTFENYEIEMIDLPGNYSLSPYSVEEIVSRDAILEEENDAVINIIDAENIQRNLYLTLQILETGANTVIALNMLNYAEESGFKIDVKKLEETLGVPVVVVDAREGDGIDELIKRTIETTKNPQNVSDRISYGSELDDHLSQMKGMFPNVKIGTAPESWINMKILEGDDEVLDVVENSSDKQKLKDVTQTRRHLEGILNDQVDNAFIDSRYSTIEGIMKEAVKKPKGTKETFTDKVDKIFLNRILGLPIFAIIVYLIFQITFIIGTPWQDLIDAGFTMLIDYLTPMLGEGPLASFVLNGVIGGVGSILTFIPIIFILFFLLSFVEDCGYLARAAFVIDRFMNKVMGLSGKSFIPMILGFGCDIPGVMATRTLANESDRIATMLAVPFISCSARIPIYALFTAVFFKNNQAEITTALYLLGMIVAILVAWTLKHTTFKDEPAPFIMELPPYRMPTLKSALLHMWERGYLFIKKAGTIILGTSILVWLLSNLPIGVEEGSAESVIGVIGSVIAPIFSPLGFGFWQAAVALVFGIMAKEIVVSTFGTLFGVGEDGLDAVLPTLFTPLSSLSFMVFTLLYVPCFACLGAIKEEANSWKWMMACVVICCVVAYICSLIVFQGGLLLGFK